MYNTLEEKKIVFDEMGRAISKALPGIRSIELDIFKTEDKGIYEYIVVTFKGGAISVRNANINSMSANVAELGKLLNGGYYAEVEDYIELRKKDWYTKNISIDEETFDPDEIVECPQCGEYELKDEMVTIKGVDICRSCKVDV